MAETPRFPQEVPDATLLEILARREGPLWRSDSRPSDPLGDLLRGLEAIRRRPEPPIRYVSIPRRPPSE